MHNTKKTVAWLLLATQLGVPVGGAFFSVAHAASPPQRWLNSELPPAAGSTADSLPDLGSSSLPQDEPADTATRMSENANTVGSLLSENNSRAAQDYATGLAVGAANQQVNEWLNQIGHARFQFGTNKTGNADLLYPWLDSANHLVFSHTGIRVKSDRTTSNLGLGYRYFDETWMWGVNSFYDHDFTGNNNRLGLGAELGADYIRLSANGYFRLTDWHNSRIDAWKDYRERPANGFDIRLNTYLPAYPQVGADLKYEQYFGDGVNLKGGSSESDLRNNPKAYTAALTYTPVPLVTIKAGQTMGSMSETVGSLELSYRFGVPFSQQIDPEAVNTLRKLSGSRYDFVDRNYDIVMQYQKQELLAISLPATLSAQAKQTLPLTATVVKTKYGVKSFTWSAPALLAAGGTLTQTSLGTVNITLPSGSKVEERYEVSVVAVDSEGNKSNTATSIITALPMNDVIADFSVSSNPVPANGIAMHEVTVTVKDDNGNPVANTEVTFTLSGFTPLKAFNLITSSGTHAGDKSVTVITDSRGVASVKVSGTLAQTGQINAALKNSTAESRSLTFTGDAGTATILSSNLMVVDNNAIANGSATNSVQVTVTDANGNPVTNQTVTLTANSPTAKVGTIGQTDVNGQVIITVTDTKAEDVTLTAGINGASQTATVTFIADADTATLLSGNLKVVHNNAVADGKATNSVQVTVTDANGNAVPGQTVTLTADSPTAKVGTIGQTDANGQVTISVTNTKAKAVILTAGINGASLTATVTFIADASTATLLSGNLTVVDNNAVADGKATNSVQVTVTDVNSNPVAYQTVTLTADSPTAKVGTIGQTDANGQVIITVTDTKAEDVVLTAGINGASLTETVTFIADANTATLLSGNLKVVHNNAIADGKATNSVQVTVTDANDNPVANQTVTLTADSPTAKVGTIGQTDANGQVTITVTNTKAEAVTLTAGINNARLTETVTFVANADTATLLSGNLKVVDNNVVADGKATNSVQVTVTDANGNPVANQTVTLTANSPTAKVGTIGQTDANGNVTVTITNTKAEAVTLTAGINGASLTETVTFIADVSTARINRLTVMNNNAVADGKATNSVRVTVTDANGNPLAGEVVGLTLGSNTARPEYFGGTDANGNVIITVTDTKAEDVILTANINGSSQNERITFIGNAGTATIVTGNLKVVDNNVVADGKATNSVQVTVTDANGNPVAGQTVTLTANRINAQVGAIGQTDANGQVIITVTAIKAEDVVLTAGINGASQTATVTFIADTSTARVNRFIVVNNSAAANGKATNSVQVTVTDAYSNPLSGQTVTLTANSATAKVGTIGQTDANGNVTVTVTNTKAEAVALTTSINGGSRTEIVTFIADANTAHIKSFTILNNNARGNSRELNTVQVTVTDAYDNLVSGQEVTITSNSSTIMFGPIALTNANGEVNISSYNSKPEDVLLTANVNGSTQSVTITFTPGPASSATSTISVNATSYNKGDTITVTAVIRDNDGHVLPGQSDKLTSGTVTVGGSELTGSWTEQTRGHYTAEYTAKTMGKDNRASLKLPTWSTATQSENFEITGVAVMTLSSKGATFDKLLKYPATAYAGAKFNIDINDKDTSKYDWSSDSSSVTVSSSGVVTIEDDSALNEPVTITVRKKGVPLDFDTYTFTVKRFFTTFSINSTESPWMVCNDNKLASPSTESIGSSNNRAQGTLLGEYGEITSIPPMSVANFGPKSMSLSGYILSLVTIGEGVSVSYLQPGNNGALTTAYATYGARDDEMHSPVSILCSSSN